jgi:hypothetical protein
MRPLTRHQILLYQGDFSRLAEIYSSKSASEVIRELVDRHLRAVEARLAQPKEPTCPMTTP